MPVYKPIKKGVSYSQALAEAYASAPSDVVIFHTLELHHPSFYDGAGARTAARIVNDYNNLTATLEFNAPVNPGGSVTFYAIPFELTLPTEDDGGSPGELVLSIDNCVQFLHGYLEAAAVSEAPIQVYYRPYLSTDLSAPHISPPLIMTINNIKTDDFRVTARCGFGSLTNRRFPYLNYTVARFPGLTAR